MKAWGKQVLWVFTILLILVIFFYLFLPTMKSTKFQLETRMAVHFEDISIEEIYLPKYENFEQQTFDHGPLVFTLPFIPTSTQKKDELFLLSRFFFEDKSLVLSTMSFREVTFNPQQYCKESKGEESCLEFIEEINKLSSFHTDFEEYIKVLQISEEDLSIFDNRHEKIYESLRLMHKFVFIPLEGVQEVIVFRGDNLDGVLYVYEDRIDAIIFTKEGGFELYSKKLTREEIIKILSSIVVKN